MVAITVILAAVIGAFVLEIGDQQETAPNTSFDSSQQMRFVADSSDKRNLTQVGITHAGGDTLGISNNRIKVNGNASWWGIASEGTTSNGYVDAEIQPDTSETAGSNEEVSFTSGETWSIVAGNNDNAVSHENFDTTIDYAFDFDNNNQETYLEIDDNDGDEDQDADDFAWNGPLSELETGDNVNVVWTASSGGKTQTLFKYTVQ
jgi:FlaG/FlaF family flagellin (archaellin)